MEERRKIPRSRTYLTGRLAFNRKASTVDCVVRNLTEQGARIAFSRSNPTPADIEFCVPSRTAYRPARLVWRSETEAGLMFVG